MPSRPRTVLLLAASLLLAGCLPESKNPLSTPATSTIDGRLEGVYVQRREKRDDDFAAWHLHYRRAAPETGGQPRPTPWLEVLDISHAQDDGLKGAAYRALTTHLGGHDYMSFVELGPVGSKGPPSLYRFARYEVGMSGDLRVWMASMTALADAIRAGKIQGEVKHQKDGDDVLLTDSTEHLAKFVAGSDPVVLFGGKPLILYRLAR